MNKNLHRIVFLTMNTFLLQGMDYPRAHVLVASPYACLSSDELQTLFSKAVHSHSLNEVRALLRAGVSGATKTDKAHNTALHLAVINQWPLDLLELLLEKGADINAQTTRGKSPLEHATRIASITDAQARKLGGEKYLPYIKFLLDHNARIDLYEGSPLLFGAIRTTVEVVQTFIDAGANINEMANSQGTVLHEAARLHLPEMIKYLADRGANVHGKNFFGNTALHETLRDSVNNENTRNCVIELIKAGSDLNEQNEEGDTPLHLAVDIESPSIVNLFLEQGVRTDLKNKYNWNPFEAAVINGYHHNAVAIGTYMLRMGTDSAVLLNQIIKARGSYRLLYHLLGKDLRLDMIGHDSKTAFHVPGKNPETLKILLKGISTFVGNANFLGDEECVKECIRLSFALFLIPTDDKIEQAKRRIFDWLRTMQGKLNMPPHVALEILFFDPTLHEDLARVMWHELEDGDPSSSLILSNIKELFTNRLALEARTFFSKALRDFSAMSRGVQAYFAQNPGTRVCTATPGKLDDVWLEKNLKPIILEGLQMRFKQLHERAQALPYQWSSRGGCPRGLCEILLRHGANPYKKSEISFSAENSTNHCLGSNHTNASCRERRIEFLRGFLAARVREKQQNIEILCEGIQHGTEGVQELVDAGIEIDGRVTSTQDSALHVAAKLARADIVRLLVAKGASVASKNSKGEIPLHCAVGTFPREEKKRKDCIQILLDAGSSIKDQDILGQTAQYRAAHENYSEIDQLLEKRGARVDISAIAGWDPVTIRSEREKNERLRASVGGEVYTLSTANLD